jgi:hypothetical protein
VICSTNSGTSLVISVPWLHLCRTLTIIVSTIVLFVYLFMIFILVIVPNNSEARRFFLKPNLTFYATHLSCCLISIVSHFLAYNSFILSFQQIYQTRCIFAILESQKAIRDIKTIENNISIKKLF